MKAEAILLMWLQSVNTLEYQDPIEVSSRIAYAQVIPSHFVRNFTPTWLYEYSSDHANVWKRPVYFELTISSWISRRNI